MRGFQQPKITVLPDAALVPHANLVQPAPTHFTHQVQVAQPYFYATPHDHEPANGHFDAGTCVVLREAVDEAWCQVVDGRGLCVVTARIGLLALGVKRQ
jgi:hypothetical protein